MSTTTSKTRPCPNCFFPMRVRFALDEADGKWIISEYYDPTKSDRPRIEYCPACGLDLKNIDKAKKEAHLISWPELKPSTGTD